MVGSIAVLDDAINDLGTSNMRRKSRSPRRPTKGHKDHAHESEQANLEASLEQFDDDSQFYRAAQSTSTSHFRSMRARKGPYEAECRNSPITTEERSSGEKGNHG